MEKSKPLTFIGFAIRARKVRAGTNAIATLKGGVTVLIICESASENAFKEAIKLSKKFNAPLVVSKTYKVEDLIKKQHCKLLAIQDESLGNAILQNLDNHFQEYSWRDNT
ncbi:MAG: hypothetical protein IJA97_05685 [Clostridia bacterium]|nr:hypothetical protein [Clostridia bacterium]